MSQLSNRKSDLERLEALKSQVLEKYNSASPELQAKAAKVASSYRQYYDADPLRRGNAIELETDAYQRMSDILDGKTGYNEINAGTARTNAFGKYSSDEISNIGNEITRKALSQPAKSASSASAGSSSSAAGSSGSAGNSATTFYKFNWDKLNTDYLTPNSPLSERATSFISSLISNLKAAQEAVNSGARIKGLDKQAIEKLPSIINGLNQIAYSNVNWNTENLEELDGVVSLLKRYAQDLNLPVEYFSNYFNEWFDPSEAMTNKRGLIAKNYKFENPYGENTYIKNLLDRHGWRTATKDGKTYVFDSDWKAIDTPYSEIFDDASKADMYNLGVFINDAGQLVYGNVDDLLNDDTWRESVDKAISDISGKRSPTHYHYKHGLYSTSDSHLINTVAREYSKTGLDFNYHDISAQFSGKTPVIAVGPNGQVIKTDRYGNLVYPQGTAFYYETNGEVHKVYSLKDVAKNTGETYNYKGYAEDLNKITSTDNRDLILKGETNLTGDEDLAGRGLWGHPGYFFFDDIKDDPQAWVKGMIAAISNPDGSDGKSVMKLMGLRYGDNNRDLLNAFGGIRNIVPYLIRLVEEENMQLTGAEQQKLRAIITNYIKSNPSTQKTAVLKSGGTIKMAEGEVLDYYGNPVGAPKLAESKTSKAVKAELELEDEAKKAGYDDTSVYKANMRKPGDEMSPTDFVRFGALAADIASIPAAWVPGAGSAVSAGLGIGSSFATLFTDITEDGFQFHDLTGLGINLAMDAAGVITGGAGKVAKIVKGAIKFSPFLFAAWEGMAHGDLYAAALKKLTSKEKMTVQDWRTLAAGVSLIAGMNRSSASMYKQRQIKNNANLDKLARSGKLQEREIDVTKDGKVEKLKLNPEQAKQVAEAKSLEEVNAIIKGINKDYSVKADSKVPGLKNKNPFKGWRTELKEAKTNPTQDEVRGAMLEAEGNQKYLGGPQQGEGFLTKYLVNPVNRTGLRYGLASDMDIAIGNTSGFLGLYKGNNNTEKYTSAYNKLLKDIETENTKTANEAAKTTNKATKASKSQFTPREARVLKQIYKSAGVKNRKEFAKKYQTKGHEVKDLDKMEEALLTSYRGTQKTFELNDLKIKEALTAEEKPYTKVPAKDRIARMSALLHENAEAHYDPKVTFRDLQRQYHFKSGGHIDRMKAFINNRQHES